MPYNILNAKSGIILHQVNCQGVMASGVAGTLRQKYPEIYEDYMDFCINQSGHKLGKTVLTRINKELAVISVFGQEFYGRNSVRYTSYDALDDAFFSIAQEHKTEQIHVPDMIGCGLGGGNRDVVLALLNQYFKDRFTLWTL
jgi:O-acetyl-ADP-ribose deacetylase (regulator of RNase III)